MDEQIKLNTVIMRGGSSKGLFLRGADLPADPKRRDALLLTLFGSPDRRQIDGLGGADLLTSKCAIIDPPTRPGADLDYTFAQVGIDRAMVSYDVNCGNISAAVAVFAIEEGFVEARAPATDVRVHNTNTGKILRMSVPVHDGRPRVEGDCAIDGVPGTGAEIGMDFSDTAGAVTGRLLPTGNPRDTVRMETLGRSIELSIVDLANLCAFARAEDFGIRGTELPGEIDDGTFAALDEMRARASALADVRSDRIPFQVLVSEPRDYDGSARSVGAGEIGLVARAFVDRTMHKAYSGTGGSCLAVAARIGGTIPNSVCTDRETEIIRIGHPSGVLPIRLDVRQEGGEWHVRKVHFSRTARRLMEGTAFIRRAWLA